MLRLFFLRVMESYFRHRWLYLLPIVIMVVAAFVYYFTLKPLFVARGVLYIQSESLLDTLTDFTDNSGSYWISPSQSTANEMNELLQTAAFVRAVIQQTDLEQAMTGGQSVIQQNIKETRDDLMVYALGNNQLMVSASNEDPVIAFQLVESAIENYLNWKVNVQRADTEAAQEFFTNLIRTYETDLTNTRQEMRKYLEENPDPIVGNRSGIQSMEIDRLQSAIDLAAARYAKALDSLEETELNLTKIESDVRQTYFLIDAPRVPEEPEFSLKTTLINMAAFIAAGVIMSSAAILGDVFLDRSFRFPIDVKNRLELPVIAMIPDVTPKKERKKIRIRLPKLASIKLNFLKRRETDTSDQDVVTEEEVLGQNEIDRAEPV